jgi:hypothetical protein
MKKILALTSVLLLAASLSYAQKTGTTTLSVSIGAEASIVVGTTPAFTSSGTFQPFTATTPLTYQIRTTSSGLGSITVEITTDFSTGGTGGGPSVTTPPTSGDLLTYTSTVATPGAGGTATAFSAMTASMNNATNVATFSASSESLAAGNTASVAWSLTNDPAYKAGSYSAVATLTIAAT